MLLLLAIYMVQQRIFVTVSSCGGAFALVGGVDERLSILCPGAARCLRSVFCGGRRGRRLMSGAHLRLRGSEPAAERVDPGAHAGADVRGHRGAVVGTGTVTVCGGSAVGGARDRLDHRLG